VALTDCLNFGDPVRPAVWRALAGVVEGMRAACQVLGVPIISGNVSLYNETEGQPIIPTPVVGALGVLEQVERHARAAFDAGQVVGLLGPLEARLALSEYATAIHGWAEGLPPALDLELEQRVQACARELIAAGQVTTATDVAEGGLAVALAELALAGGAGMEADATWAAAVAAGRWGRPDAVLFGEAPSRIIVAAAGERWAAIEAAAARWNVPVRRLGATGGSALTIGGALSVELAALAERWATALDHLEGPAAVG
jgi:phosphoribosylformylglycinamidine synthase